MSTASTIPQLGRAWRLEIQTVPDEDGSSSTVTAFSDAWQPEPLTMTFETYQTTASAYWYADIAIYNLNEATEQLVLKKGMQVTLWGGYQNQPYGIIFQGALFQPMWERENVTDFKLTLHCIVGVEESTNNFISMAMGAYASQRELIAGMAAQAHHTINLESIDSEALTKKQYPRGQVVFGNPGKVFEDIARDNSLNYWISGIGANVRSLRKATSVPTYTFGPGTGLIGTPQATQDGISCRVLLDARISLGEQIFLDMSSIRQLPRVQGSYATILDHDGIYIVGGIAHRGDTRETEWYSDLVCYTSVGGKLSLLGS